MAAIAAERARKPALPKEPAQIGRDHAKIATAAQRYQGRKQRFFKGFLNRAE
ncbi:MAG: hypothetical protein M9932_12290 [Xanthobacteraceae bacterium]|nr:hypothetical protein [Xanthobacteraceae bacterium]